MSNFRAPTSTLTHSLCIIAAFSPSTLATALPSLWTTQSAHSPASMLQNNTAKKALQCLPRARRFSSTPAPAAISPYRQPAPSTAQTPGKRNVSDSSKRSAQAAQTAQRTVPSPAFNRTDETRYKDVQPLQPFRQPEMDHSFVGMTGGEIFHEMMLRQGVEHVCTFNAPSPPPVESRRMLRRERSWLPRRRDPARLRCDLQQQALQLHPTAA